MNITLSIIWLVSVGLGYYMGYKRGYIRGLSVAIYTAILGAKERINNDE